MKHFSAPVFNNSPFFRLFLACPYKEKKTVFLSFCRFFPPFGGRMSNGRTVGQGGRENPYETVVRWYPCDCYTFMTIRADVTVL